MHLLFQKTSYHSIWAVSSVTNLPSQYLIYLFYRISSSKSHGTETNTHTKERKKEPAALVKIQLHSATTNLHKPTGVDLLRRLVLRSSNVLTQVEQGRPS